MLLTPPQSFVTILESVQKKPSEDETIDELCKFFLRDFTMSWLARGSLAVLPQLIKAVTKQKHPLGNAIYDAYFRGDALKFGIFVASYFTTFKIIDRLLQRKKMTKYRSLLAGALATVPGYLLMGKEIGAGLGSYLIFRAIHSLVLHHYQNKAPSGWEEWAVKHGNTLLFCLSVGQLMYAFIVDPSSLETSYLSYLKRVSYLHPYVQKATQNIAGGLPVDFRKLSEIAGSTVGELVFGTMVPCECFHPGQGHVERVVMLFLWNFRDVLPVYIGLYTVPQMLVKGFQMFELGNAKHLAVNVARSSSFISAIIALYQAMFCMQRTVLPISHRYVYWVMGVLASLGVLIEKRGRRTELALYVLPKAAHILLSYIREPDSAGTLRLNYALFALAMSLIMHFYRNEPTSLSPLVKRVLSKFL